MTAEVLGYLIISLPICLATILLTVAVWLWLIKGNPKLLQVLMALWMICSTCIFLIWQKLVSLDMILLCIVFPILIIYWTLGAQAPKRYRYYGFGVRRI